MSKFPVTADHVSLPPAHSFASSSLEKKKTVCKWSELVLPLPKSWYRTRPFLMFCMRRCVCVSCVTVWCDSVSARRVIRYYWGAHYGSTDLIGLEAKLLLGARLVHKVKEQACTSVIESYGCWANHLLRLLVGTADCSSLETWDTNLVGVPDQIIEKTHFFWA